MNEAPVVRSRSEQAIVTPAQPAYASLVLRHAGGALVAPLSAARSITVGRRLPADVIIDDRSLALQHARFSLVGEGLSVEDLGSRSGTWVAGQAVKSARLRSGQSVRLGNVTATVHVAACKDGSHDGGEDLVAGDDMRLFYDLVRQVAATGLPVLVEGETGSGKRVTARVLHTASGRIGELIALDCDAHSPFAADAQSDLTALELAESGSLLLRNVGSLSAADQASLLCLLQTGRPAANAPRADVRVIALESRPLGELVLQRCFRADLYRRLAALTLRVPPLRERRDEIGLFVARFLSQVAHTWGREPRGISPAAVQRLHELPWPGNIAQLEAAIEHADLVCSGSLIESHDLPGDLALAPELGSALASETPTHVLPPSESEAGRAGLDFKGRVREYEVRMIVDALKRSGGNQRATARLLRIPLRTLAHKIKAFRIKQRLAQEVAKERGVSG